MSTELIIEADVSKKKLFSVLAMVQEFEKKYSAYREDSLLASIAANAGKHPVKCSGQELEIFQRALEVAQASNGVFDPTIGVLTQGTYGFGTDRAKVPNKSELQQKKELVDYKKIKISTDSIYLTQAGMQLDLGGIGKGYIADKIVDMLRSLNATRGLVSVGGEIVSFSKAHTIAVQNPFKEGFCGIIKTQGEDISISTSGDYERYIGSREHHHILDNHTAQQNHYYSSLTLIKNGIDATFLDAFTTVAFNTPPENLQQIATDFKVAIFAISPQKEIYIKNFENLKIKNFELYCL